MKAAVAKVTSPKRSNAKTDLQVLDFILLIRTYDNKVSHVVSVNLGGPFGPLGEEDKHQGTKGLHH